MHCVHYLMCRSADGRQLVVASSDGYCSIVVFDAGELGTPLPSEDIPEGVYHIVRPGDESCTVFSKLCQPRYHQASGVGMRGIEVGWKYGVVGLKKLGAHTNCKCVRLSISSLSSECNIVSRRGPRHSRATTYMRPERSTDRREQHALCSACFETGAGAWFWVAVVSRCTHRKCLKGGSGGATCGVTTTCGKRGHRE